MTSEVERAGPEDLPDQGMSNCYSVPDSELMVGTWGDENRASSQYSPVSINFQFPTPEVASLYLTALNRFIPRIYLAVF